MIYILLLQAQNEWGLTDSTGCSYEDPACGSNLLGIHYLYI